MAILQPRPTQDSLVLEEVNPNGNLSWQKVKLWKNCCPVQVSKTCCLPQPYRHHLLQNCKIPSYRFEARGKMVKLMRVHFACEHSEKDGTIIQVLERERGDLGSLVGFPIVKDC